MKTIQPYLTFNGNCEEAMNFYKSCIGGELNIMRFGDAPSGETGNDDKNLVMHSTLSADGAVIMASDGGSQHTVTPGTMITINLNFDSKEEETAVFNKLAAGGNITMSLNDTFWGAHFGMLTDKFGIQWMLNCENQGAKSNG